MATAVKQPQQLSDSSIPLATFCLPHLARYSLPVAFIEKGFACVSAPAATKQPSSWRWRVGANTPRKSPNEGADMQHIETAVSWRTAKKKNGMSPYVGQPPSGLVS